MISKTLENIEKDLQFIKEIANEENFKKLEERCNYVSEINEKVITENKKYCSRIKKTISNNQRIIDYGYDYDGFNNVEDLKKLIDMLVDYARKNKEILEKGE